METILSGYCRACDSARMVLVDTEEQSADCAYPDCPHAAECGLAAQIRERLESQ